MSIISAWRVQPRKVEDAIWMRRQAFEKRFCEGGKLIEVGLTSNSISITYVLPADETDPNGFSLDALSKFLQDTPV